MSTGSSHAGGHSDNKGILSTRDEKGERNVSKALLAESTLKSSWYIIEIDGKLVPLTEYDFRKLPNLEKLKNYEVTKVRAVSQIPPHVDLMKKLGMADYEPASDPGNMRFYPKGRMIKSLLETYVTQLVLAYGGLEVETPLMYDFNHPSLASYLNRFPARQYIVESDDRNYFLRFAACFGQFLIAKDLQISYRQLPLKLYELTRYSFRREKSGELVGLRRLRAFTMPDCHALVRDIAQAKEEFPKRFTLSRDTLYGLGLEPEDFELALRFTEDFYKENKEFIESLVKLHGRPALVEMWSERFFYYVLKWEFNFIDNLGKAAALSTDQIDIENAERYGIRFVDETGNKRFPLILHNSPSGAIERDIYALLEKQARIQREHGTPMLPLWLCPTQVRLVTVSDNLIPVAKNLAARLTKGGLRADIDDRALSVGKKIRDAEMEWVPYIIVLGEKESSDATRLPIRVRETGKIVEFSIDRLVDEIKTKTSAKPNRPLPLPAMLTERPEFEF